MMVGKVNGVLRFGGMVLLLLGFGGALLAQGAPIVGTAGISLDPRAASVVVGSNIVADLTVNLTGVTGTGPSGVTPAVLGSYIIDVTFDATKLQFVSVTGGTTTEFASSPTSNTSNAATGTVRVAAVQNSASAPTGKVFVATFTFKALAAGSASLSANASSLASAYQPPDKGPVAIPSTSTPKSVTVQAPVSNTPPVLNNPGARTSAEGATVSLQLTATDADGDAVSFAVTNLPPGLTASSSGLISGVIGFNAAGSHTVQITVSDGKGGTDSGTFVWTVTNTNRNPSVTNPGPQITTADASVSLQIAASDPDGDSISFAAAGLPPGLTIHPVSGLISGTVSAGASTGSPYSVSVSVTDGNGGSQAVAFAWTIVPVSCSTPGTPTLSAPVGSFSGDPFSLNWSAVPGASEYELQRSADSSFTTPASIIRPAGSTSYSLSETASTEQTIYFRIRARAVSGSCDVYGAFSAVASVVIQPRAEIAPPQAVSQPSPQHGTTTNAPVTLSWAPGANATSYDVYFGTASPPPFVMTTTNPAHPVAVVPNTTYYWSVTARNSAGSAPGPLWSFSTSGGSCTVPNTPVLSMPVTADAGSQYVVSWSASAGATDYLLEKATTPDFANAVSSIVGGTSTSFVSSEPPGSTLYFRVQARNVANGCSTASPWSSPGSVVVASAMAGEMRIIPVVSSGQGAFGSYFRTTVQLHNRGVEPATGRIIFHPQGVSGTPDDPFITYSLEPGETEHIVDIVAAMGREGAGSADLVPLTGMTPRAVVRVFNDAGAAGTTGTNAPLMAPSAALQAGERALLIAPPDGTRERFNVGVRTLGAGAQLAISVRQRGGERAGVVPRSYPATYFVQTTARDFAGTEIPDNAVIEIEIISGSAIIYGSATDNITQDPSMQVLIRD